MPRLRRTLIIPVVVALLAALLVPIAAPATAQASGLDVFIRDRIVNGQPVKTYRIAVPVETTEHWEERVIPAGEPLAGATHCVQVVVHRLDTEFLSQLPYSSWTGFPNGSYVPSTIGYYSPTSPDLYGATDVVDLAELSERTGYPLGAGLGIVATSFATTLYAGCSQYRRPIGDLRVPVVGVAEFGADLQVSHEAVPGQPNTYRFTAAAQHPVVGDLPLDFRWEFERGSPQTGTEVTHTFTSDEPTSYWYRRWQVTVTSPGIPNVIDRADDVVQSIGVELELLDGDDPLDLPVDTGKTFDVRATVSAPSDNPGTIRDIAVVDDVLDLPNGMELILPDPEPVLGPDGEPALGPDGEPLLEPVDPAPEPFDLAPGDETQHRFTVRATEALEDEISSEWSGTDAAGRAVSATGRVEVHAVGTFEGDWFRMDGLADGGKVDDTVSLRLRAENATVGDLSDVRLVGATVEGVGELPGEAILVPAEVAHEGQDEILHLPGHLTSAGPTSIGFEDFTLEGVEEGEVLLRAEVQGRDAEGALVEGIVEEQWTIRRTDIDVEITFDPPEKTQVESEDPEADPEPVEMTAEVTLTNVSGGPLTDVEIAEWEVSRLIGEQELFLDQVGGLRLSNWDKPGILLSAPTGVDDLPEPFDLAIDEERTFTADFIARDDGQLDFHLLALGADDLDRTVRGFGEASWVLEPEKYLEVTTEVIMPTAGTLLQAGDPVVIKGRVTNLSQTATLEVGPLIPIPSGNTGQVSLVYGGGAAPDPTELPGIPDLLELGPNDSELFEVAIATGYSDPRTDLATGEPTVDPSGGTRAYFEFDPWAIATEADGTVRTVRTDPEEESDRGVKISDDDREFFVSIDDSIAIPEIEWALLAGGIGVGVVKGIVRGGVGLVVGIYETVGLVIKAPFTLSVGLMEYQSRVWNSFTPEEKLLYSQDLSTYLVAMAVGNVENGLKDVDELENQINTMVLTEMTRLADEWETGDYVSTAEAYAAGGTEIAASLWLPAAMTKLAQTPRAAAALERAQVALNARMAPIFDAARGISRVEDALPLLRALENGAEISSDAMRALYGVAPDEVAELQRLAAKYDLLITFRSRHPSSVEWIQKFGAMMKPEAIKIKSVSEMDLRLGYREGDLGSVVFRKPDVLRTVGDEASDAAIEAASDTFLRQRGFAPGTKEFDAGRDRIALRVKEWRKHEAAYKEFDRRKFIETEFDYEGNAIPDLRSPSSKNRTTGFKLDEVGPDEYVVRLMDPRDGKFKRVTGDIDPIAFTNLDGSPLTTAQHRDLIDEMRRSELLRAQHPESATFVGVKNPDGSWKVEPGLDFIESQFKPGEAAAQIGPAGPARAVRLNKGKSRYEDAFDYHLHWEGGYKHVGGRSKISQERTFDPDFGRNVDVEVPSKLRFKPLELGASGEAGIGRGTLRAVATGTGTAVFVSETGDLIEVLEDGSTRPWEGSDALVQEGEPVLLEVAPAGQVEATGAGAGAGPAAASSLLRSQAQRSVAAAAPSVGGVTLVDDGAPVLFAAGQVVAVGVQHGQGVLATIASVDGRTLWFTESIGASVDDIVVMVEPAPSAPGGGGTGGDPDDPDDPDDPSGTPDPDDRPDGGRGSDGTAGTDGNSSRVAAGGGAVKAVGATDVPANSSTLARTGSDLDLVARAALAMVFLGLALTWSSAPGRRRRPDGR